MELFLIFTAKKGNGILKHEQSDQNRAPVYEALEEFRNARRYPSTSPDTSTGRETRSSATSLERDALR